MVQRHLVLGLTLLFAYLPAADAVSAKSTPTEVYLAFEDVFFSHQATALEPWLSTEYELQQHTYVLNFVEESRTLTREKVLYTLEQANDHAETPKATSDNIEITEQSDERFCMQASVEGQAQFMGRSLYEISTREACFEWRDMRWQVVTHKMNNRYQLAAPQTGDQKPTRR